jgi:hypothetical protein
MTRKATVRQDAERVHELTDSTRRLLERIAALRPRPTPLDRAIAEQFGNSRARPNGENREV